MSEKKDNSTSTQDTTQASNDDWTEDKKLRAKARFASKEADK